MQDFRWPPAPDDLDVCEIVRLDGEPPAEGTPPPAPSRPLQPVAPPRRAAIAAGSDDDFDWPPPEGPLPAIPDAAEGRDGPVPVLLHVPPPRRVAPPRPRSVSTGSARDGRAMRLILAAVAAGLSLALAGRAAVPVFTLHWPSQPAPKAPAAAPPVIVPPGAAGAKRPASPRSPAGRVPGAGARPDSAGSAGPPRPRGDRPVPDGPAAGGDAIERALEQLTAAYARLDVSAVQAVWPTVDAAALGRAFQALDRQELVFEQCAFARRGGTATADCDGRATWVARASPEETRTEARRWTFTLQQDVTGWRIVEAAAR